MSVAMVNSYEIRNSLIKKIQNGWILFDMDDAVPIEHAFYTPGTEKNRDFEIWMFSGKKKMAFICIGKKHPYWDNVKNIDQAFALKLNVDQEKGMAKLRLICADDLIGATKRYLWLLEEECGADLGIKSDNKLESK